MNYNFKLGAEASWAGVSVAVGGLIGAILVAVGIDEGVTAAAVTLTTALVRGILGALIPEAP